MRLGDDRFDYVLPDECLESCTLSCCSFLRSWVSSSLDKAANAAIEILCIFSILLPLFSRKLLLALGGKLLGSGLLVARFGLQGALRPRLVPSLLGCWGLEL